MGVGLDPPALLPPPQASPCTSAADTPARAKRVPVAEWGDLASLVTAVSRFPQGLRLWRHWGQPPTKFLPTCREICPTAHSRQEAFQPHLGGPGPDLPHHPLTQAPGPLSLRKSQGTHRNLSSAGPRSPASMCPSPQPWRPPSCPPRPAPPGHSQLICSPLLPQKQNTRGDGGWCPAWGCPHVLQGGQAMPATCPSPALTSPQVTSCHWAGLRPQAQLPLPTSYHCRHPRGNPTPWTQFLAPGPQAFFPTPLQGHSPGHSRDPRLGSLLLPSPPASRPTWHLWHLRHPGPSHPPATPRPRCLPRMAPTQPMACLAPKPCRYPASSTATPKQMGNTTKLGGQVSL